MQTESLQRVVRIPPQSGRAFKLRRSEVLRVSDPFGEQVSDLFAFKDGDSACSLSSGRSIDYAGKIFLTTGDGLYANDSRRMFTILADTAIRAEDIDEKALYYRAPYTSQKGVKQFLPSMANYKELPSNSVISPEKIIDLTNLLQPDGSVNWKVPPGNWTIMRLGSRNNGAVTRPAPMPGLGFEADKMDTTSINAHLVNFTGKLFKKIGVPDKNLEGGLKVLHMDSWEMGAQNWSPKLREEFLKRRGYDPLKYYPVYSGLVVESLEKSERLLWDLRLTSQELVIENHAMHLKKYGQKYNLGFSIEPYDMNPTADMELGAVADVPMCEFWSKDY